MIQSQKLTTIEEILLANKGKEINYNKNDTLYVKHKITQSNLKGIKEKFIGFDAIEGCKITNNISGKVRPILIDFYNIFHINLYSKGFVQWIFWFTLETGIFIETFFFYQR